MNIIFKYNLYSPIILSSNIVQEAIFGNQGTSDCSKEATYRYRPEPSNKYILELELFSTCKWMKKLINKFYDILKLLLRKDFRDNLDK